MKKLKLLAVAFFLLIAGGATAQTKIAYVDAETLLYLMPETGKIDSILQQVWGDEVVVGDRTIDVHIRKLREKIGDSFFKTIKGVGYKIEF